MSTKLYDGNYILVAYVCTADGIRISELVSVVMSGTVNEEIAQEGYIICNFEAAE